MVVVDWLHKQALQRPGHVALVDLASGREVTYRQFNERASRFAEYLLRVAALEPGARVAVLALNSSDYLEMLYGCAKAGMVMVCLNWRLPAAELVPILDDADPALLVAGRAFMPTAHQVRAALPRLGARALMVLGAGEGEGEAQQQEREDADRDGVPEYERTLAGSSGRVIEMAPRAMDEAWHLLYTSGTTGKPKGVIQTYGMVFFNAVNCMLATSLSQREVLLNVLPFFHTGGLNLYANPVLHAGGTVLIMQQFDAGATIALLDTRATMFLGVPAVYLLMSQHPDFEHARFAGMRHWSAGGSPVPHSLLQRYQAKGITICFGYGMTETGPTVFICDEATARRKLGTIGRPVGSMRTRVVKDDGSEAGPGERGELLINGPGVTPGYWNAPEASAAAFADGWLRSGDVAYVDDDGDYYIVDRVKDMYISGGENVYPAEVENVLFQMPQVGDAAVIGVADPKWGDAGAAIVVLRAGCALTPAGLQAFCRTRISGYKVPKHVVFVDALPRNPSGKLEKQRLRAQYGAIGAPARVRRRLTQDDFDRFARLSGDDNPIHCDPVFAARTHFGATVAHGMFLYSLIYRALCAAVPQAGLLQFEQELMFPNPSLTGDEVEVRLVALEPGEDGSLVFGTEVGKEAGLDRIVTAEGRARVFPGGGSAALAAWAGMAHGAPGQGGDGGDEQLRGLRRGMCATAERSFGGADLAAYAALTGEDNPLHYDEAWAKSRGFAGCLVPPPLLAAMFSDLLGTRLPGRGTGWMKQKLRFLAAAHVGERLTARVEIIRLRTSKELVNLASTIAGEDGRLVCSGEAMVLVRNLSPAPAA